jgi:hypothetical protein
MTKDINFSLDHTRTTSSFQGVRESLQEVGKPRQTDGRGEALTPTHEEQEQQFFKKIESLKSNVERFQEAGQQTGVDPAKLSERQNHESQQYIALAERRELQFNRQEVSKDARAESRNPRSNGPAGANELMRTSKGSARGPQDNSNEDPNAGSDFASQLVMLSTINRIEKFQDGYQIESIKESTKLALEKKIVAEQALLASQIGNKPTIGDLEQDVSVVKGSKIWEQLIAPSESTKPHLQNNRLLENDTKTKTLLNEEKVAEDADAFRNEPKLSRPTQVVEPIERPLESINEGLDTNTLPGPRPLDSRDVNGSSVETQRGQNVSKLI